MAPEQADKRVNILQYINTGILTLTLSLAGFMYANITSVKTLQLTMQRENVEFSKEILRIKTIQDINTASISTLDKRINTLELNYLDYIKTWVDQNYVRKPQSK
jgi:hypothetical protein